MKAVVTRAALPATDPHALEDAQLDRPMPGPHDLLVRVEAVSVNPVDTKLRRSAPPPGGQHRVLGYDAAGVVEAVGGAVTLFRPGDAVFYAGSMDRPGSNAEYQLVDARIVGRKPATLDFAEAAALPLTALTAWELLFDRIRVPYGDKTGTQGTLLVIGGAGGVGGILIQLAARLTGLTVVATASRPETVAFCEAMGAHHVIDHRGSLDEALLAAGFAQAEYVASLTATDVHLDAIARLVAPQGHVAVIDDPPALDVMRFKRKSVSLHWEFMFARPLFQTPNMIAQHRILNEVSALADAGVLRSTMTTRLGPIDAAALRAAHVQQESGRAIGKTVLAGWHN